jgi:hypothetical protein
MNDHRKYAPVSGSRTFSYRSVILGAAFIATLIAAVCIDVTGVLEYFRAVAGTANDTLEMGAIITAASIAPFLAAGFSISADYEQNGR